MNLMGIAGWSGSGKTTLVERLIPHLRADGWRVGVAKHAHHHFDPDIPGKDSYRFRQAGACAALAGSSRRWALIRELADNEEEPNVWEHARRLTAEGGCDLILAEGFKRAAIPKLEVWRRELEHPLLSADDSNFIAVVAESPPPQMRAGVRLFSPEKTEEIAAFITARFRGEADAG